MNTNPPAAKFRRSAAMLFVSSFLALVLVGLFFQPEIVSMYWHTRFGNSTLFHGWKIPVPKGWWAVTHGDELSVQKMRRFYDGGDPAVIVVETFNPPNTVEPQVLRNTLIQTNSQKGYMFQGQKAIRIGTKSGECLHFSVDKDKTLVHISCDSLPAQLALDLYGRASDIQTFYSLMSQIEEKRGNAAAPYL